MLLWPGTGGGEGTAETEKERRQQGGKNLFRIPRAVRHVPLARCDEVTLRPRVPHRLFPADQCAEHGPQEYRAGCRQRSYRGAIGPGAYKRHV